jgi:stage III sporulation protein AC
VNTGSGLIFQIAAIGIIISLINTVLKQSGKDEQGQMVTLVGVVIVATMVMSLIAKFFLATKTTFGMW